MINNINAIVSFLVSNKAVKNENSYGYKNVSIEIENNYGFYTVVGYHSFHLNDGHGVRESLFNILDNDNQHDIFLSYCNTAFTLYDNNIIQYDDILIYLADNAIVVHNSLYINDYAQLSMYRHTSEEESESLFKLRYRYSTMLRYFNIDKGNKDYNKRFEIYRKDELFIKFPILNELEGFNDEIICNLLYALFILNDIDKAIQTIRKDVLRCYGPDYYDGLCNRLDLDREQFHYVTYVVGGCTDFEYLEKLS